MNWTSILLLVIYFKYITKSILLRRKSPLTYFFQNIPWRQSFLTRNKLHPVPTTLPKRYYRSVIRITFYKGEQKCS